MVDKAKTIVQDAVRLILGDDTIDLAEGSTAEDYDGWDSVAHSKILLIIEEKLGVELPIIEVMDVQTVGELIHVVRKMNERVQ